MSHHTDTSQPSLIPPAQRPALSRAGRYASIGPLVAMGLLAVAFLAVVLFQTWRWTHNQIDQTANQQVQLAVEFGKAVRDYVGKRIRPEMDKRVQRGEFVPEAMSTSFVARHVFDQVQTVYPDIRLRFASTQPRNPVNRATPAEESLIRYFEEHPEAQVWSGTMELLRPGEQYYVCAVPRRFEASCLQCHGRPEDAPASLLERYGRVAGFGRALGAVSVDLAAVPVSTAYAAAQAQIWRHMLTALGLCLLFLGGIAFLIWVDARRCRRAELAVENERNLLRLERDRAQGYLDVADVMLLALDGSGRVTLVNRKGSQILGYEQQELLGRDWFERCLPQPVQEDTRRVFGQLMAGDVEPVEYTEGPVRTRSGAERIMVWHNALLKNDSGKVVGTLSSGEDITDRKQADRHRTELLEQLASINQELKDFAYVVSHDLKAPLRAIKTLAEWLIADYQDKLDEQGKESLRMLGQRVERMHSLIDGVLQYSRVGRDEQQTSPVDLGLLVPEIIENLGVPAHIAIHLDPDLPTIQADPTRITQVFQNLLSNAIKYMDKPQGDITVGCVSEADVWKFSVADNGPGIEAKHFERIFKLFQTLERRDDRESTGVGLTVAKKIVELYGGKIWVESEVGHGSTFFFTFPKQETEVQHVDAGNLDQFGAAVACGSGIDGSREA